MAWGSRIARMEFAHGQGWRLGVVSRQVHGGGDRGTGIRMSDGNLLCENVYRNGRMIGIWDFIQAS
jgi:hypothetical protein